MASTAVNSSSDGSCSLAALEELNPNGRPNFPLHPAKRIKSCWRRSRFNRLGRTSTARRKKKFTMKDIFRKTTKEQKKNGKLAWKAVNQIGDEKGKARTNFSSRHRITVRVQFQALPHSIQEFNYNWMKWVAFSVHITEIN